MKFGRLAMGPAFSRGRACGNKFGIPIFEKAARFRKAKLVSEVLEYN